jgi:hypothetical protein
MPNYSHQINATDDWTQGFTLQKGQTGTLTATGTWTWDENSGRTCGPGGNGNPPPPNCPTAGREGCLDWRITMPALVDPPDAGGEVLYLTYFSSDNQSYAINVAGNYEFRMNDNKLDDNSGSVTVTAVVA